MFSWKIASSRTSVEELPGKCRWGIGCPADAEMSFAVSVQQFQGSLPSALR